MTSPPILQMLMIAASWAVLPTSFSGCEPPAEGEGEGEGPPCFIGDPQAEAEMELVYRTSDGAVVPLHDGEPVPLILPIQGGKVIFVGVRAKNVTCSLQVNAGLFDKCSSPELVVGREGRPVLLEEGPDGFGTPVAPSTYQNFANIPACPSFVSLRDLDGQDYRLELRATEKLRPSETEPRTHVLGAVVVPVCEEEGIVDDCRCECDHNFSLERSSEEQCPTINDNDLPQGVCPP